MGPRKKAKPNPKAEALPEPPSETEEISPASIRLPEDLEDSREVNIPNRKIRVLSGASNTRDSAPTDDRSSTVSITPGCRRLKTYEIQIASTRSWYGGTWPRMPKAAPVTQVDRESISVASSVASEIAASLRTQSTTRASSISSKSPSLFLSRNLGSSTRSLPLSTTTTKLNITSNASNEQIDNTPSKASPVEAKASQKGNKTPHNGKIADAKETLNGPTDRAQASEITAAHIASAETGTQLAVSKNIVESASSWLGWFSRGGNSSDLQGSDPQSYQGNIQVAKTSIPEHPNSIQENPEIAGGETYSHRRNSDPNPRPLAAQNDHEVQQPQPRSWLGLWGSSVISVEKDKASAEIDMTEAAPAKSIDNHGSPSTTKNLAPSASQAMFSNALEAPDALKPSGWAFWFRNTTGPATIENALPLNVGDLAVAGTPSHPKPASAVVDAAKGVPKAVDNLGKRERPRSLEIGEDTKLFTAATTSSIGNAAAAVSAPPKARLTESVESKAQKNTSNLLLPSFKQTYRAPESLGLIQQIGRLLKYTKDAEPKHVNLVRDPPQIKKALAVGIHGYFPAPLIRTVLGQPTGTSIKFADSAADAIRQWTRIHGYSCDIRTVALEGEGRIGERVELLWKLMLNWIEDIRKSDFIMISCHSQGVPVAMMLVAKLIAFGCVNSARIGICAMAGVNLGPFTDYKSRWISGSAGELFEFARPDSQVSREYEVALDTALRFGVRTVFVGSIDDQLVSLEVRDFSL